MARTPRRGTVVVVVPDDEPLANAFDVQGLYNVVSTVGRTHFTTPRRFIDQVQLTF